MGRPPQAPPTRTGTRAAGAETAETAGTAERRGTARSGGTGPAGSAGPSGGTRRRPGGTGAATRPGRQAIAAELLAAVDGLEFTAGGHPHTVVGTRPDGAVSVVGGGPARTVTAYGTVVAHAGKPALLAHPAAEQAWDQLRSWRRARSEEQGVPPYVVFDDKTLKLVAALLPVTEPGLLAISGIGPVKIESYGSDLLAIAEAVRETVAHLSGGQPTEQTSG